VTVKTPIYLDHHATTPVDRRVLEAMLPHFTETFGNASSRDHVFGHQAAEAVETARGQVAALLNARPSDVVFTSGATESDNLALLGVAEHSTERGDHVITVATEHKAVLDTARWLETLGKRVTYLPVDQYGLVDPDDVRRAITDRTVLISVMAANNEIGTLAPLEEIGRIAREKGVLFHTDAAQAAGHVPLDVDRLCIDLMSLSGHKIYGPKGVGALFVRSRHPRVQLSPLIRGGGHERGLRSGTLNVPGIVGMGKAAEIARDEMAASAKRLASLTDRIYDQLRTALGGIERNGHPERRLPHNLNVYIAGIESKTLIVNLPDLAFSTGAACTSSTVEPSHVILALGYGVERAHQSIRLGLGRLTTDEEVDYVIDRLI
jgi:cysteine desulfurase